MSFEEKGFEFDEFFLNISERILSKNGIEVALTPKAVDLLLELVKHSGRIVSKDRLMESVWAGSMVEEANLPFTMGLVRKALGDDVKNPKFIETLPKKGYRFIAKVRQAVGPEKEGMISRGANDALQVRSLTPVIGGVFEDADNVQSSDMLLVPSGSNRRYLFFGALTFIALTLVIVFWGVASKLRWSSTKNVAIKRITSNGETSNIAASPDGKFLAYVLDKGDYQSLWLHDVVTNSDIRLSPVTARDSITSVAFAPDGEYIYYTSSTGLNRIPVLGGTPELVLDDIRGKTNFAISPDGKEAAFLRSSADENEIDLIVASTEDHSERILATSYRPRIFFRRVSWSPDGKSIACGILDAPAGFGISILRASDGTEIQQLNMGWIGISNLIWRYDGGAIFAAAADYGYFGRILQVDIPSGNVTRLTDDSINYQELSMSSDGSRLFAVRQDEGAHLWILPVGSDLPAKELTRGFDRFDGMFALAWVEGGRLIFGAYPSQAGETDSIRVDGSDQDLIVKHWLEAASPDGHFLILNGQNSEREISVYDMTNGSRKTISTGTMEVSHAISPDGKWIAFTRWSGDVGIWKIPISGGEATRLTLDSQQAQWPGISRDGRFVAFYRRYVNAEGKFTADIAYVDSNGGNDIKRFAVDAQFLPSGKTAPQWSADGKSIYFVRLRDGASNIWKQPIDGSEPTQLTHLESGRIYNFIFSPDESQVALSYGPFSRDVVQIEYR